MTMQISIERAKTGVPLRYHVRFTEDRSTHTEFLTQGELIDLWTQIGVLFNLMGMREERQY